MHSGWPASATLFAIHISDGVLTPGWLAGGFGGAGLLVALSLWRVGEEQIPRIGLFTAAFFAASQFHIPAGVATVHLMLNGVVGVVLRRFAPVSIAVGLALQALLFGHGGWSALGVNTCVLTIPALLAGFGYPLLRRCMRFSWAPLACGCAIGLAACLLTVALNVAVLLLGGQENYDMPMKLLLVAYAFVVPVEAALTGIVVQYLERVKPEWVGKHNH
jgi:cobalt/nickel transport system permease protein